MCPMSHSRWGSEPGFEPMPLWSLEGEKDLSSPPAGPSAPTGQRWNEALLPTPLSKSMFSPSGRESGRQTCCPREQQCTSEPDSRAFRVQQLLRTLSLSALVPTVWGGGVAGAEKGTRFSGFEGLAQDNTAWQQPSQD